MIVFYRSNPIWMTSLIIFLCSLFVVTGAFANSDILNFTLLYSGDEQGLLTAHGCDQQIGGLDHRYTLIKSLYDKRANVLNLHTGNIIVQFDSNSELIYQIALEALSVISYDVVSLGPGDLCLPVDSLKALHANHPEIPFVCANLEEKNALAFVPYIVSQVPFDTVKSVKIAVVGLIEKEYEFEIKAYNPSLSVTEPGMALTNIKDELERKSDFVVVLFHAPIEKAQKLAQTFSWLDVIIVSQDEQTIAFTEELGKKNNTPIIVGKTIIVTSAPKGESVGVLDIGFDQERQIISSKNQLIEVSEQIKPSSELSQLLVFYEELVEDDGLDSETAVPDDRAVHLVYFYKRGCDKCAKATKILKRLREKHPEVVIEKKNVKENQQLLEAMGEFYNIPEAKRLTTPAVFIGDTYFLEHLDEARLESVIQKYLKTGVASQLSQAEATIGDAKKKIVARFRSFGTLTVAGAGLLDGINPCAFATIVFFISYLSLVGRKRKEILMTGAAFTSAVFVTYFLLGIGTLKFLEYLNSFSLVAKIVYLAAAIATFTLAILSLYDAYKAKMGKVKEIKLQLPRSLKRSIHKVIRERTRTSGVILGALVIGFAISALELVCTGQVYLPTITFVAGIEGMRIHALSYLLLYNLMFIVPLLVIFFFVYWGTTSVELGGILQRHLVGVKIGTGMLLLGLGIWLLLGVI